LAKYLSNIELYYTHPKNISEKSVLIEGEEYFHITKVMRHQASEVLYVTNGEGKIYSGRIKDINKKNLELIIESSISYENKYKNIFFCIPKLRNSERFEFALEKCVELGITNFLIFDSERTISKSNRSDRWNKILLSAMKQSLNSFLPKIELLNFKDIFNLQGIKIGLEQTSQKKIKELELGLNDKYYFVFGPEGGISEKELNFFEKDNLYKLAENRLRTETAIILAASLFAGIHVN
jgi:16S rRNA (uracil1498-N3)-methyltransferase